MGATKRISDQIVQWGSSQAKNGENYVSVRFGNVLGSRGSVIPIFKEQIKRGGPLSITHPDMVRYFMTIPEASQRSEEHTSELQSRGHLVCRLLLEKKKT